MFNNVSQLSQNVTIDLGFESYQRVYEIAKWMSVTELIGIIVFNLLVIAFLFVTRKKGRMAFFVRNLAIADLSVGILFLLPEIIVYRFHVGWNREACYFFYSLKVFPIYVSTFSIVALSVDRAFVITKPLVATTSGVKSMVWPVVICWVMAGIFSLPYCIGVRFYKEIRECGFGFDNDFAKGILIFDLAINLVIPIIIIGTCYTIIAVTVCRRHKNNILEERKPMNDDAFTQHNGSGSNGVIAKARIRTIKLLFIVVIAYIVCWTPVSVGTLLNSWGVIDVGPVYTILYALAPLNSMVNPIVFLLFNLKLLRTAISHKPMATQHMSTRKIDSSEFRLSRNRSNS